MFKVKLFAVLMLSALILVSCAKKEPAPTNENSANGTATTESNEKTPETVTAPETEVKPKVPAVAAGGDMTPLPFELPKPMFVGTPQNIEGVERLEKPRGKPRPPFMAPAGCVNLAFEKPVTGSEEEPIMGDLEMITDGDKEAADGSYVELGPFQQYVTIDLEKECEIYAVLVWHFHKQARVYFDVVAQVSMDKDFIDTTTVYNNDIDNSEGMGVGEDNHYVETSEGRLIDAKGSKGRYVRLYSVGNNANDLNHYIEIEVWGK